LATAARKIAFVFPGQGAQAVGMGKDLAERYPASAEVFRRADEALGFSLSRLCFEGPDEALRDTANAQPALLAAGIAACEAFRSSCDLRPDALAGHSLGEYSALVAAGALSLETGLKLVRKRGELMAAAGAARGGAMAAVIGLDNDDLQALCDADPGQVVIANLNSPGQAVISGETDAVERVGAAAKSGGAKRVVPLAVSGAFHSPLVQDAADRLAAPLEEAEIQAPAMPVYSNVTARPASDASDLRRLLARQVVSQVRWDETARNMAEEGIDLFIEFGPGKVLSGLLKRIVPSAATLNVEDSASLEKTLAQLNG
jgi:[acyl-carrier-protein] S-malonyltransferase